MAQCFSKLAFLQEAAANSEQHTSGGMDVLFVQVRMLDGPLKPSVQQGPPRSFSQHADGGLLLDVYGVQQRQEILGHHHAFEAAEGAGGQVHAGFFPGEEGVDAPVTTGKDQIGQSRSGLDPLNLHRQRGKVIT